MPVPLMPGDYSDDLSPALKVQVRSLYLMSYFITLFMHGYIIYHDAKLHKKSETERLRAEKHVCQQPTSHFFAIIPHFFIKNA